MIKRFQRWVVRWRYRWQMWRDYDAALNRRAEVEAKLFYFAGSGQACPPQVCKELAIKLGVARSPRTNAPHGALTEK